MAPSTIDETAALQRGFSLLQSGDARAARALAESRLGGADARAAWLTLLALALSQDRQAERALPHFIELTHLEPGIPEHWSNLGNCLCELGREGEALDPMERALKLGADDPGAHFAAARALLHAGATKRALAHVERARRAAPGDPEFALLHARALLAVETAEPARVLLTELHRAALDPGQRAELGYLELRCGEVDEARASFERALTDEPGNLDAAIGLGLALERSNAVDEARAVQSRIQAQLARNPPTEKLRANLLQLEARLAHRGDDHARTQDALRELLDLPGGDPLVKAGLWYELGRSLDQTRQVDAAMTAFQRAHADRRAQVLAAIPQLGNTDLFEILAQDTGSPAAQTASPVAAAGGAGRDPAFLVGFPRSGTTLLEQLLDAHEGLASFDEQPFLQRLIERMGQLGLDYPADVRTLAPGRIDELRGDYFAQVARVVPDLGARRAVDKNPLNMVRLPLVSALFPQASVILALRHPCDVVLSCYMQNFRAPAFSLTFETLARAAEMYDRVMAHWKRVSSESRLPIHVLRYEDLVADVRGTGIALFEFLGLPWNDQLLEFTRRAQSKGAISTPSYTEVIKPVNAKAVGRWQRYRRYFDGPALDTLRPWIEAYGYSAE